MKNAIKTESFDQWMELRSKTVSSTESSALFGHSPWVTEYELWHRKKNGLIVDSIECERMTWGKRLEQAIGDGLAKDKCWKVQHVNDHFMVHSECDRMGSSFDFFIVDCEHGKGILEIKNVDSLQYKDNWVDPVDGDGGKVPMHIEFQHQHQLEVAASNNVGIDFGCIAAFVGGNTIKLFPRKRNRAVGLALLNKVKEFWKTVDDNIQPKPNFIEDASYIISQYANSLNGKKSDMSDNKRLDELCSKYKEVTAIGSENEKLKKGIKAEILTLIDDSEKVMCNDFRISLSNIAAKEVDAHTRKGYRDFRISKPKKT